MRIVENNWKVLASLFPSEWQQMAWDFGCSRAIAWVSIARRVVAYADTTCGKGLVVALVRAKLERWTDGFRRSLAHTLRNSNPKLPSSKRTNSIP
ncbi:MAG: hypothetical protein DMG84_20005 [Acidobacteria bacterium]|nr:MAG: hypothetical protein DMG84_20005 [Acidobacteriota bacterium]PYX53970.1 MAG: hypothetical protein DMG76_23335 [Acidobacteriota bacterium]